jgi:hypothetical protein
MTMILFQDPDPGAVHADPVPALLVAFGLALVHLLAGRPPMARFFARRRGLSFAGGVSVAYVFVHLLPQLEAAQDAVSSATPALELFAERHVYLIALAGLALFYGLEVLAARRRDRAGDSEAGTRRDDRSADGVYWVHIASFALYNGLVGYLLLNEGVGTSDLVLFGVAMALHFLINDASLERHHEGAYRAHGRWLLAGAVLAGYGVGLTGTVDAAARAVLVAFLAGGIVLNVLKEELPRERQSRFGSFALGAVLYAALLLAL